VHNDSVELLSNRVSIAAQGGCAATKHDTSAQWREIED